MFSGGGEAHSSPDANFPSALQTSVQGHVTRGRDPGGCLCKASGRGRTELPGGARALTSEPLTCSPPEDCASERPSLNL